MPATNKELIDRLIKQSARLEDVYDNLNYTLTVKEEWLPRFASLIAEECAKIVDGEGWAGCNAAAKIREAFKP